MTLKNFFFRELLLEIRLKFFGSIDFIKYFNSNLIIKQDGKENQRLL